MVSQNELIACAKEEFKKQGFKKKNKRWTKETDDFTLVFFIQGSQWSSDDYYIRPGVFINAISGSVPGCYGHVFTEIRQESIPQIFRDTELFFRIWTDKSAIKETVLAFMAWEERNPLEKRRAGEVDYDADPVPSSVLFAAGPAVLQYVIENF